MQFGSHPLVTISSISIFDNCQPDREQKHLTFLNDKDKELSMLDRHVEIKQLFLRYNTTRTAFQCSG